MRIFMTGASGWIGSGVVPHLLAAGHEVTALARSDASAFALETAGVTPVRGSLDDLDVLSAGAAASDAVIHLGFKHDFSDYAASGRTERAALEAFADALQGTGRKLVFASGMANAEGDRALLETDQSPYVGPESLRGGAERFAFDLTSRDIAPVAVRFSPTVHGTGDHGFSATFVRIARENGVSGYIGDGSQRWAAVHRDDAGRLVSLALEKAQGGSVLHAAAEEGVPTKEMAEAIGRGLGVPVDSVSPDDAPERFGYLARFFGRNLAASSTATRELLGWEPREIGLLQDLEENYPNHAPQTLV